MTLILNRDYGSLKRGTRLTPIYRYSDNSDIPMIRVAREDRRAIKTNVGVVLETSIPAAFMEDEIEEKAA